MKKKLFICMVVIAQSIIGIRGSNKSGNSKTGVAATGSKYSPVQLTLEMPSIDKDKLKACETNNPTTPTATANKTKKKSNSTGTNKTGSNPKGSTKKNSTKQSDSTEIGSIVLKLAFDSEFNKQSGIRTLYGRELTKESNFNDVTIDFKQGSNSSSTSTIYTLFPHASEVRDIVDQIIKAGEGSNLIALNLKVSYDLRNQLLNKLKDDKNTNDISIAISSFPLPEENTTADNFVCTKGTLYSNPVSYSDFKSSLLLNDDEGFLSKYAWYFFGGAIVIIAISAISAYAISKNKE
ncbi:hypothetical protein NEOKW01_1784 [Nematocida sp. AWRm80]|nr:hypothetical protein NEOKW01_1784 [Nematocida sp. AWRm80]